MLDVYGDCNRFTLIEKMALVRRVGGGDTDNYVSCLSLSGLEFDS